ncbi:hypothetical protein CC85DRAFT_89221 [Cutaneotrichosporon oleaginosum]|uniref:Uncharacterized protein n=1 Tax=Cutaneotrichosporon oleaginosum TaxID=879819 RepID=A0A0J0XY07_9TREE|nr:uncharacterized protein CC85DRAFT_89221 [Cutaneotrichosporon oleaginosum]KLT45923.1 hypothetical protein CC85DRAFT_89221 [Cutaneotrichosporon oleaginosum]TXT06620.1 hypothetical protein COLE_05951 [Cutaneotrichosporon oleaginosum]
MFRVRVIPCWVARSRPAEPVGTAYHGPQSCPVRQSCKHSKISGRWMAPPPHYSSFNISTAGSCTLLAPLGGTLVVTTKHLHAKRRFSSTLNKPLASTNIERFVTIPISRP